MQSQQSTGQSTPQSIKDRGQIKAYYRFINNKQVKPARLIEGYASNSLSQTLAENTILAIQDTTTLHYTGKRSSANLGCLESAKDKGFMLHNHLLMNEIGNPLGLLSQQFYSRKAEDLGKRKTNLRKKTPFQEKESYRWLEQFDLLQETYKDETSKTIIEICDREADIHEVLQARKYDHIHYIIRSSYGRAGAEDEGGIWEQVANEPYAYRYELKVPEGENRTARLATMEVRYKQVTIRASYRKDKSITDQSLWILETKEIAPPANENPIHWRLLTSIPIILTDLAAKIIQYYVYRWIIERFHYVLKQGFKVEELQIEDKESLQNAIILKSWAALDVMALAYTSKTEPEMTLQQAGFQQQDYNIAYSYAKKRCNSKEIRQTTPTLSHFTRLIAQIGGHSLQKGKTIGIVSIWRGWNIFAIIKDVFLLDVGNQ